MELTLDFSARTPVERIRLLLIGIEKISQDPEKTPPQPFENVLRMETPLCGHEEIGPGRRTHRARFPIPLDAPSSYIGRQIVIAYELRVEVVIPWWPDVDQAYPVSVAPRLESRPPRAPVRRTTACGSDDLFFEITLDDSLFAPGDVLSGALALGNVRARKIRGLSMALIGRERTTTGMLLGSFAHERESSRLLFHFQSEAVIEGRAIPFRLALPTTLWPSFQTRSSFFGYALEVQAKIAWGLNVSCEIPILVRSLDRPSELTVAQPSVGAERWRAVWAHAGAPLGLRLAPADLGIEGELSGLEAAVFPDLESSSLTIAAELRYPNWGLGLRVRMRRLGIFALEDGDGFGRRYRVDGREPSQTRSALTRRLRGALLAFEEATLDDDHVRVRSKAESYDQPHIGRVLERLAVLAVALR